MNLRIGFDGPGGWFSSNAQVVPDPTAGNDCTKLIFQLDELNFTYITGSGGTTSFSDTMKMVSRFEIFSSSSLPAYGSGGDILRGDILMADIRFHCRYTRIKDDDPDDRSDSVVRKLVAQKKTRHTLIDG